MKYFTALILLGLSSFSLCEGAHTQPKKTDKPYVIGAVLGQLGNRLFQVATASAVAWDNEAEAYFPDFIPLVQQDDYKHIFFRCNIEQPTKNIQFEWNTPNFGYVPIPFRPNMRISGYGQCEKYFAHHRDKIIKLFAPHPKDLKYIKQKYKRLLKSQNTVSIHLRYYYREKPDDAAFVQYEREYFEKAMNLFSKNSLFVVTSDNIDFARSNIPTDGRKVLFIENEPYYIDFFIQSLCKHNIISNSSFSWWSAWLNKNPEKIVVRPKVWLQGYPDIDCPDTWIKIDAESMQSKLKKRENVNQTS